MVNVKEIVDKIKSTYPEIRIEEKVIINEQFTANEGKSVYNQSRLVGEKNLLNLGIEN